jgi:heme/copper-type cytochrome/quinol oxidase subunit 4
VQHAVCLDNIFIRRYFLALTSVFILTDVILTIIPLTFVLVLHRPLKENLSVAILMLLGIIGTTAQITLLTLQIRFSPHQRQDYTSTASPALYTANIESWTSIIAACTPTLKSFLTRLTTGRSSIIPIGSRPPSKKRPSPGAAAAAASPDAVKEDRFTRDLGLDALPDNLRISQARERFGWRNWSRNQASDRPDSGRSGGAEPDARESRWGSFLQSLAFRRNSSVASKGSGGGAGPVRNGSRMLWGRSRSVAEKRRGFVQPESAVGEVVPPVPVVPSELVVTGMQEGYDSVDEVETQRRYLGQRWRLHRVSDMSG